MLKRITFLLIAAGLSACGVPQPHFSAYESNGAAIALINADVGPNIDGVLEIYQVESRSACAAKHLGDVRLTTGETRLNLPANQMLYIAVHYYLWEFSERRSLRRGSLVKLKKGNVLSIDTSYRNKIYDFRLRKATSAAARPKELPKQKWLECNQFD